jgi:UDP-GlcNAc3NAcA epimerase
MLKILTLIGARPQFIKSAAISRAIRGTFSDRLEEVIVHSGQHYDENMSSVFFEELNLPTPNHHFQLSARGHSDQTAEIIHQLEKIIDLENPKALLVYGDTNTTLAGALVASKNNIPLIHVEAGLRSYNKKMPEEINRILTDHCSSLLFCPSKTAVDNLKKEGIVHRDGPCNSDAPGVYLCGDVMYDNSLYFSDKVKEGAAGHLAQDSYTLFTLHRPSNTDDPDRLKAIYSCLCEFSETFEKHIIFPIHPRTKKAMMHALTEGEWNSFRNHKFINVVDPVSFHEMISLEKNCDFIITDSGGVQKEAYFFKKPCLILRSETEWVEIIDQGVALLVAPGFDDLSKKYQQLKSKKLYFPELFGDGKSAEFICDKIVKEIQ